MLRAHFGALILAVSAGCGPAVEIHGELLQPGYDAKTSERADSGTVVMPHHDAGPRPDSCPEPTLASIREKTFLPSCGGSNCHAQPTPALGLDLTLPVDELAARLSQPASESLTHLVLVKPGQYGASYLYLKVFLETPGEGQQMPPAAPLDDCSIGALRDWIQAGAPSN